MEGATAVPLPSPAVNLADVLAVASVAIALA